MSELEDAGNYEVENQQLVQGQVVGPHPVVHQYFGPINRSATPPMTPLEPIWMIPFQRNGFFLGQDDLFPQLHHRLTRGTTTALTQIQAISGLGGIGKTQIAIEYAYRSHPDTYPYVFWMRAEHRDTLISDLVSLASPLQLPEQHDADQIKVVAAVKRWLATHQGWLLIFDNADDLSLLSPFLPEQHTGAILLTTRASQTQPVAEPLLVEQMNEQVGADFLLHRARLLAPGQSLADAMADDEHAARQLCKLVGGLPLALDQAGAYIDETQCTPQDYLSFYQQDQQVRAKLLERRGKVIVGHPEPVATTWALAFARVEEASPAAVELLRACAFLAPDLIPEDMLRQGSQYWGSALARAAKNAFEWNETIGTLLKYALVRRSREHKALSMHRLVQTVLKDAMDSPTFQQWTEHTIQAVEHVFPDGTEVANWSTCKRLLPHAQACAVLIDDHDLHSQEAATLLYRTANYLSQHARYSEAEPLFERALRIREQLGPERPDIARVLHNLGALYADQGKYAEAEPLFERALRIQEHHLGPEHPDVAYPLNDLAILYAGQGKHTEAEPLFERALRIWEDHFGPDHPLVAYPLYGLASLYREQGKHAKAEPLYQRALRIWEDKDHPDVASSLHGLANLYIEQGKHAEAEPLYQRALRIWEDHFGPDHPLVAYSLNNLAVLSWRQGKYAQAEPLYQRALHIWERALGREHFLTQNVRRHYASLLHEMGRDVEARMLEGNG